MKDLKEIPTIDLVNELKHRQCVSLSATVTDCAYSKISIIIELPTSQVREIFN